MRGSIEGHQLREEAAVEHIIAQHGATRIPYSAPFNFAAMNNLAAARATGAEYAYAYIRYEYPLAVERMRKAVADAEAAGLLGKDILGTGMNFEIIIVKGAGSYVCGDETGLINSIAPASTGPEEHS